MPMYNASMKHNRWIKKCCIAEYVGLSTIFFFNDILQMFIGFAFQYSETCYLICIYIQFSLNFQGSCVSSPYPKSPRFKIQDVYCSKHNICAWNIYIIEIASFCAVIMK